MPTFVVYKTNQGTPTQRPIVRWGAAPVQDIATQIVGPGEAALQVDDFTLTAKPSVTGELWGGYVVDPATKVWSFIAAPPPNPPVLKSDKIAAAEARINAELRDSDWTQLPDTPLSPEQRADWTAYRDKLRKVSIQTGFPNTILWPLKPAEKEIEL